MHAEQLTPPRAHHGEGPVWLTGTGWPDGLSWVDMLVGDVLSLGADGSVTRRHVGDVAAVVRPRRGGGLVYAVERGFVVDDGPGTELRPIADAFDTPGVRMNEGGCDPAGAFWCGSMAYDATPGAGSFYRLDATGDVTEVAAGWTIPNGLAWTAEGHTAYHADTTAHRIDVLTWDATTGLHDRRPFVAVEDAGAPDGLTVDAEGGVWVAVWGAGEVRRYAADGSLDVVVRVPAAQVSACTFGGDGLRDLYITTSREGLTDPEPAAGAVFVVRPGVVGLPALPYAG